MEKEFEIKIIKKKKKKFRHPIFSYQSETGDRQTFIKGRLSKENNFDQKLLLLILSQRKRFKSNEMIVVVINEIIKRPLYMSEKN